MISLRHRFLAIVLGCCPSYLLVAAVVPTTTAILGPDAVISGYETVDESLVYQVPQSWELYRGNLFQRADELYFVLAPKYDSQTMAEYKLSNPEKVQLPLPSILSETTLFLGQTPDGNLLGDIQFEVSPEPGLNQGDLLYFKLSSSVEALPDVVQIIESNLGLTGYLYMSYALQGTDAAISQIPIIIQKNRVDQADSLPDSYPALWLRRLLDEYCLDLDEFIDAEVSLGFQSVNLVSKNSQACFDDSNLQVAAISSSQFLANPINGNHGNIDIWSSLSIPQLGIEFDANFRLQSSFVFDQNEISVEMQDANIVDVDIADDALGDFYKTFVKAELKKHAAEVSREISIYLTAELQTRIIDGSLLQ